MMSDVALVAFLALQGANALSQGSYLCTVHQKAGIASLHLEDAPPPAGFSSAERYAFRMIVTPGAEAGQLRAVEGPYDGPDRSARQWQDENSTLHNEYIGDGREFNAIDGPGVLSIGRNRWGDGLQFNLVDVEYAGGEDETYSVRWGTCERE